MMTRWPADYGPIVNCPWLQNEDQGGASGHPQRYSARQLVSATLLSSVTADVHHQLYFVGRGNIHPELMHATLAATLKLQEISKEFVEFAKKKTIDFTTRKRCEGVKQRHV